MTKSKDNTSIVIWVEDKEEEELDGELQRLLAHKGIALCHLKNVDKLAEKLDSIEKEKSTTIRGFIIDMMLDGPNNLSSFGLNEITWNEDADAGRMLLEHVLKKTGSSYEDIPTLVLSVRMHLSKTDFSACKNTDVVIKRELSNPNWEKDLKKWVDNL